MKRTASLALAAALMLAALMSFSSCGLSGYGRYDNADKYTKGGGEVAAQALSLDITWVRGDVEIRYHSGDKVEFYEESDRPLSDDTSMYYYLDGGTLRIQGGRSGARVTVLPEKKLTVLLPSGMSLGSLELETVEADASVMHNGNLGEVDIDTVSGDVSFDCIGNAGSLDISCVSGSVDLMCGVMGEIGIDTVSGDVTVATFTKPTSIEAEATSGDITLVLPSDTGFTLEFDKVSGSLISEFATSVSGDRYVSGDGSLRIEVDVVSGNLNLIKG